MARQKYEKKINIKQLKKKISRRNKRNQLDQTDDPIDLFKFLLETYKDGIEIRFQKHLLTFLLLNEHPENFSVFSEKIINFIAHRCTEDFEYTLNKKRKEQIHSIFSKLFEDAYDYYIEGHGSSLNLTTLVFFRYLKNEISCKLKNPNRQSKIVPIRLHNSTSACLLICEAVDSFKYWLIQEALDEHYLLDALEKLLLNKKTFQRHVLFPGEITSWRQIPFIAICCFFIPYYLLNIGILGSATVSFLIIATLLHPTTVSLKLSDEAKDDYMRSFYFVDLKELEKDIRWIEKQMSHYLNEENYHATLLNLSFSLAGQESDFQQPTLSIGCGEWKKSYYILMGAPKKGNVKKGKKQKKDQTSQVELVTASSDSNRHKIERKQKALANYFQVHREDVHPIHGLGTNTFALFSGNTPWVDDSDPENPDNQKIVKKFHGNNIGVGQCGVRLYNLENSDIAYPHPHDETPAIAKLKKPRISPRVFFFQRDEIPKSETGYIPDEDSADTNLRVYNEAYFCRNPH